MKAFSDKYHFIEGNSVKWLDPDSRHSNGDQVWYDKMVNDGAGGVDLLCTDIPKSFTKQGVKKLHDFMDPNTLKDLIVRVKPMLKETANVVIFCTVQQIDTVTKILKDSKFLVDTNPLVVIKEFAKNRAANKPGRATYHAVVAHKSAKFYMRHNSKPEDRMTDVTFTANAVALDSLASMTNIIPNYQNPAVYLTGDKLTHCKSMEKQSKRQRSSPLRTEEKHVDLGSIIQHRWCPVGKQCTEPLHSAC
jgi:hypothetical protein